MSAAASHDLANTLIFDQFKSDTRTVVRFALQSTDRTIEALGLTITFAERFAAQLSASERAQIDRLRQYQHVEAEHRAVMLTIAKRLGVEA
jgi:hypothetical protein